MDVDAFPTDGPAADVLNFVNTHDHLGRYPFPDRFGDPAGLNEWLGCLLPPVVDPDVTAIDCAEAREVRDALVTVLLHHADSANTDDAERADAERALNRAAMRYPLQARFFDANGNASVVATQPALAGVLGTILAAVVVMSQSGEWSKVKACRNCHHGFVDHSRNLTAIFCSTQCKSQAGMRAYRSRKREQADR